MTSFSYLPYTLSYLSKYAALSMFIKSLIATTSRPGISEIIFSAALPILPKPLIAIFFILFSLKCYKNKFTIQKYLIFKNCFKHVLRLRQRPNLLYDQFTL